ncbi:hypothetical protein JZO70_09185 [Enterococcus sp. 669A]|uniref:DUF5648 domain-containing protein n=1 Tax=Candidatus Enterococcus moelleringii TaxID=2815325 RepID=A0ABS3LBE2_9ENTE|nr:hypothetical protein [Enterococcus sp. 669A]MBO1306333.1 hypothetical protein [Enterococcus sp. 669A]
MKKGFSYVFVGAALAMCGAVMVHGDAAEASTLYRAYNPNTGEHLYTQNHNEIPFVVNAGWQDEGTAWTAPDKGVEVHRLFNPNNGGDHFYTLDTNERDHLTRVGWTYEGLSWHSGGQIPVYRLYNPNAKSGTHHYTTDGNERNHLVGLGWRSEGTAFYATSVGQGSNTPAPNPGVTPKKVDENITGVGGQEANVPGSYRNLYSNKAFDNANLSGAAAVEFSADVAINGSTNDYETQFVIGGTNPADGQIGVGLHYQAGSDANFAQGRINTTNINFPAGAGTSGQQYYSVNTNAPRVNKGQAVNLKVKYFTSGYMQAFVNNTLVGQYQTKLATTNDAYILHVGTNAPTTVRNLKVFKNGADVTSKGRPSFDSTSFDFSSGNATGAY